MNVSDFTYLLKEPNKVDSPLHTRQLEDILEEYPYFQAARALHLKGLRNLNSYKYNNALKVTAAHTTDRNVLFEFITSKNFLDLKPQPVAEEVSRPPSQEQAEPKNATAMEKEVENEIPEIGDEEDTLVADLEQEATTEVVKTDDEEGPITKEDKEIAEIPVPETISEETPEETVTDKETESVATDNSSQEAVEEVNEEPQVDDSLPQNISEAETILDPALFQSKDPNIDIELATEKAKLEAKLEMGKPLEFTKKEKHSFSEWLQLTATKPQDSAPVKPVPETKRKKFALIDRFIEKNPKIVPAEHQESSVDVGESLKIDQNELMTETLAKVYLEQKKYKKAIQAYKILSLKYPEKSGFFADRIKSVEKLRKDNS